MERRFRRAVKTDLNSMDRILKDAVSFLGVQNIDQWQEGFPNREQLENDIKKKVAYLAEEDDKVQAMCAVSFEGEKSYKKIEDGAWLTDGTKYAVVHRFAVHSSGRGRGYADYLLGEIERLARENETPSIRVDTHHDNKRMQHILERNGYQKCGVIRLIGGVEDGIPRMAYEKVLKKF